MAKRKSTDRSKLILKHICSKPEYKRITDTEMYCWPCDKEFIIACTSIKSCIGSHEKSKTHQTNLSDWKSKGCQVPTCIDEFIIEKDPWINRDLTDLFCALNIPFFKVNNQKMKWFVRKWCNKTCPDESTLRNHLKALYDKSIGEVRRALANTDIYVQLDEASIHDRAIVCILVGNLDGRKPRSYCIDVTELDSSINSVKAQQCILKALNILWPDGVKYERVKLLSTDQAAYFLASGRTMKDSLYPRMLHVTCLCHALHNVCEKIKKDSFKSHRLVAALKTYYSKSSRRKFEIIEWIGENWPKEPIKSRWGSWVKYCVFLSRHYDDILTMFLALSDDSGLECLAMEEALELLHDPETKRELNQIYCMRAIVDSIEKLEKRSLTVREQKDLIDSTREILTVDYQEKLDQSLGRNPDYQGLIDLASSEGGDWCRYAPMTSVDVERAFSQFKNILTDRRICFTSLNLKHYCVRYYNENNYQ